MFRRKRKPSSECKQTVFSQKQDLAFPGRYYGGEGTIHNTGHLDVETCDGAVVAVWFRCQMLPFVQHIVDGDRAQSMLRSRSGLPELTGVEVRDA